MNNQVEEYYKLAIDLQTKLTVKIVENLASRGSDGYGGAKVLELCTLVADALVEVHTKTAAFIDSEASALKKQS